MPKIRKLLRRLMGWPIHPQWFTRKEPQLLDLLHKQSDNSLILDIGCADKWIKNHLPANVRYIGLDYPSTSIEMYRTQPDVYGSAEHLPFNAAAIDVICILDVLEHIKNPLTAMQEASRVLKASGKIILRVPFLYPIHDAPMDFTRFTLFGLQSIAEKSGLKLVQIFPLGHPLETTALLRNLAYAKAIMDLIEKRNPLCLLGFALPFYFLINNLLSFLAARLTPVTTIMPHTYLVQLGKVL